MRALLWVTTDIYSAGARAACKIAFALRAVLAPFGFGAAGGLTGVWFAPLKFHNAARAL
jgi:hypothetical protein